MKIMRSNLQGSALLTALFIMAIAAIMATALMRRIQNDIHQTTSIIQQDKRYLATQVVKFWAIDHLLRQNTPAIFPIQTIHYPGIILQGTIEDQQAKFNLNNLYTITYQVSFEHLIGTVIPDLPIKQRRRLATAVSQWIILNPPEKDPFLSTYQHQHYFPGYQPMQSPSELRLVAGITAPIYQALKPYITVLPEITPINLMTAPKNILLSLGNGLNEAQVQQILKMRDHPENRSLSKFQPLLKQWDIAPESVSLESRYFLVSAKASDDKKTLNWYTTLIRTVNRDKTVTVRVIREGANE